ncbi:energy transducer TonB, partial [Lutibacter sp.]
AETFNIENISFINQFFKNSLIKNRIVMITKEKSKKMKQLKYLLIVPLLLSMLVYVSCTNDAKDEILEMESILKQNEAITEGKYLDLEQGKVFVGKSLAGEIVPYEEYTQKEKDFYEKFKNMPNPIFDFSIVIDENGERIRFIKTTAKSDSYRVEREYIEGEDVPFAIIDEVPIFPGCEGTKDELRTCLQQKITIHVNTNFNSKLANSLGLKPGIKQIFVMFKIDKEGNIAEVKSRAPHQKLADEAIRVINLLPKMIPGKQNGKAVGVKYSLPIAFKVK